MSLSISVHFILPCEAGEGDHEVVEGAAPPYSVIAVQPPPARRISAPRHDPRFAGEEYQ